MALQSLQLPLRLGYFQFGQHLFWCAASWDPVRCLPMPLGQAGACGRARPIFKIARGSGAKALKSLSP
jgi:hypothetical protein